jgi:beta-glucanase (GH16 family)
MPRLKLQYCKSPYTDFYFILFYLLTSFFSRFQMPELIDLAMPDSAKTRAGFDGQQYDLVFSDEFEVDGRTFSPGDDPYWEAVDLWYGATNDQEWYDPSQITTKDGKFSILLENVAEHGLGCCRAGTSSVLRVGISRCL